MKAFAKIIGSLAIISIFGCLIYFNYTCHNKKLSKAQVAHLIKADQEQIAAIKASQEDTTVQVERQGIQHAEKTVTQGTRKQLQPFVGKLIHVAATQTGAKDKQIEAVTSFQAKDTIDVEDEGDNIGTSTHPVMEFTIRDTCTGGYAVIDGDRLRAHIIITVPFHGVVYWHRPHRVLWGLVGWGRPITKNELWSDCPNVRIDSVTSISIVKGYKK